MLRRAASNAYSWWWASHVRTKQSKWLEENLQDIEEKVQYALKLLEDEGESFAKRAEMYYKRRPELISFVEESFKAYRALAERYDHISKELQNANTTIASVFPDQVPEFAMNEDDDAAPVSLKTHAETSSNQNIPKVPELPLKDSQATKMFKSRKCIKGHDASSVVVKKSGLSKTEGVEEIDKLQKEILVLQTEKEFVKSSYENGLAKYWEIENCIMEKQGRVCNLQDEFDEGVLIEDGEAQVLMSTTALKSCQEKLTELRDKQKKNVRETEVTRKQVSESTEEFGNLSDALLGDGRINQRNGETKKEEFKSSEEKVNEEFDSEVASSCLTVTDVADKIDELVNDVINLESLFSSQVALIHRLREEVDDLKAQIRDLQRQNNSSQTDENTVMRKKTGDMDEKLKGIKDIDHTVEEQSENIEKNLTRAQIKLSFLSERLESLKQKGQEEFKDTNVPIQETRSLTDTKFLEENPDDSSVVSENVKPTSEVVISEKDDHTVEVNQEETIEKEASSPPKSEVKTEDEAFLQQFLAHGIEGREKHLLTEYTKVLRNYKELKKMSDETETKLKSENTMKDEQVRVLTQKLNLLLKDKSDGDDLQELKAKDHQQQDQLYMLIYREDNAINAIAGQKQMLSPNEKQFGARVDALLSENLNLMVRFSNSFGQIQQFDTGIKDLHVELLKIIEQKNQDKQSLMSNVRPIYKHLSEIRTELTIWLEKSLLLKEEINLRASTLKDIQNEITEASKTDSEDSETKLTIYQGAKLEGEVSNMKKENKRISEELQTGLDQVTKLQKEADKTLEKLSEEFSLPESKKQSWQDSKTRIPLRSFIFDIKPKKQRLSLFSCIQPSLYKKMKPDS
ncbi:hypothetical protein EUTSA_v10015659mg [Eutrema salsugineum]|uniref:NAB domain-containing protein n=1 Tax=Eutrema salsugineum TaxID=72664 RepID=V4N650_EUTSA|nr:protein NETWORKED 2C [Eutrema salsugineum]ESQ41001.1 hypothetical protein EUTSA_v10015659mg [Eutrema salsugineum]